VDAASTSEAVAFISLMQELKRKVHGWEANIEVSKPLLNQTPCYSAACNIQITREFFNC